MTTPKYIGGVEGGATHSNLVICDAEGRVLAQQSGPGTNHRQVGVAECAHRILTMLRQAKLEAGIPLRTPIDALGLALSGCVHDSADEELMQRVQAGTEDVAGAGCVHVVCDTDGSLATGAPHGGMVLIAGTGSNAFLLSPSGESWNCGGWGHILGDEGGAYWIAQRAVKMVFDAKDGLLAAPHDTHKVWSAVKDYFGVDSMTDMVGHCYNNFDKSKFAGLTTKLATLAEEGDGLAQHVFADAGRALARHVTALLARSGWSAPVRVVCVGSVFLSWPLLKNSFLWELHHKQVCVELELVRLAVSSALGAAWLAARQVGHTMPHDAAHCRLLHSRRPHDLPPPRADLDCGCLPA